MRPTHSPRYLRSALWASAAKLVGGDRFAGLTGPFLKLLRPPEAVATVVQWCGQWDFSREHAASSEPSPTRSCIDGVLAGVRWFAGLEAARQVCTGLRSHGFDAPQCAAGYAIPGGIDPGAPQPARLVGGVGGAAFDSRTSGVPPELERLLAAAARVSSQGSHTS
jgi:hypothetical protein